MKLPRFTAQTPPPRTSGLARASDIGALTRTGEAAVWAGVSRVGQAMQYGAGLGARVVRERNELDADLQRDKVTQNAKDFISQQRGEIDNLQIIDTKQQLSVMKEYETNFQNFLSEQMQDVTPMARRKIEHWKSQALPLHKNYIRQVTSAKWRDYQVSERERIIDSYLAAGQKEDALAEIKKMEEGGLVNHKWALAKQEDVEKQDILLAINFAGATLTEEDIKVASDMIEKSKVFATEAEKGQFRNQLKSVLNNAKTLRKEQAKALADEANKQLTDLMADNQLAITEIQSRRDVLDDTDYKDWMKIALNPPGKKANPVEFAGLYGDALDIWRGAISKTNFDKRLRGSLAKSEGINKEEYKSLMQTAEQTLKTAQAEALSRANTEAGRLIIDYQDEDAFAQYISDTMKGLKTDLAKAFEKDANERRKLQFWYLSRYNKEMRDWITENPDKVGKDFYQYSEQLKHQYWNTSVDEIKKLRMGAERQAGFKRYGEGQPVPTAEELKREATATDDVELRKQIFEYGKKLGYWE